MADKPDLVILDCDGVLVDSEPIADQVISDNLARHGVVVPPSEIGALFTGGAMASVEEWARARAPALPSDWRAGLYQEIFAALHDVPAIPGVMAVLDALDAASLPYRIGSNGPQAKMAVSLPAAGFGDRFAGRIHSAHDADVPAAKPAPDLFLTAAAAEGVPPGRAVVVGDTLNDAKAALAAGMPCFGYVDRISAEAFEAHGAQPFHAMDALPALLGL